MAVLPVVQSRVVERTYLFPTRTAIPYRLNVNDDKAVQVAPRQRVLPFWWVTGATAASDHYGLPVRQVVTEVITVTANIYRLATILNMK